jgi:hypothetical protein
VLAGHDKAELVQTAERGQVRTRKSRVRQVEVFRMGRVGTSILGRPRPLSRDRRAAIYTVIWEEPQNVVRSGQAKVASSNVEVFRSVSLVATDLSEDLDPSQATSTPRVAHTRSATTRRPRRPTPSIRKSQFPPSTRPTVSTRRTATRPPAGR